MIKLSAVIHGKVQNVHYRTFVQDSATELNLVGSVKNLSDGTVLVVAEGPPDVLKDFVEYLHEGSLLASVAGVAVDWGTATGAFDEFTIAT